MLRQQQKFPAGAGGARQYIATRRTLQRGVRFPITSRHVASRYTENAQDVLNGTKWDSLPVLPKLNNLDDLKNALEREPALGAVFSTLAEIFKFETVYLHYTPSEGPEVCVEVLRGELLSASSSLQSLRQFLKQELSIGHARGIAVSWRDAAVPGGRQHLISGPEYFEALPLPYIVGKASDWYVAEASTATVEK